MVSTTSAVAAVSVNGPPAGAVSVSRRRTTHQDFGLIVDSRGLIQQLKNNLVDRYPRDSILKELLQNADDAGATRLELGWPPGLGATAPHRLLAGPALFAANNGPFTERDARAIRSFGLNHKAADRSTIGKFGLGLKSVFHLGETFFYAATGGLGRLLNPWHGTGLRDGWNDGVEAAVRAAWDSLTDVLGGGPWFLLWLPLRRAADGPAVFRRDYPGDDLTDDPVGCGNAIPALADSCRSSGGSSTSGTGCARPPAGCRGTT